MLKLTFREIRASFGRWLAIFAIVALGVGFFCGLRLTKTAMIHTLDVYLREHGMYDFRLISTLGFTDDDVSFFRAQDGVSAAEGAVWQDVLCDVNGKTGVVLHAMSIPQNINTLDLKAGRLPENDTECVADAWIYGEDIIGQTITLSAENDADTLDAFRGDSFTVVGVAKSPLYINYERGTTSVGSGAVTGFIYLPSGAFDMEYYTDIYLTLSGADGQVYSEQYDSFIDGEEDRMTQLCEQRADGRYNSLYSDARETLDDARRTLDEKQQELADAKQKLADAQQDVADGEQKLADGQQEYDDGLAEFEKAKKKAYDGFAQAEDKLDAADAQIAEQEQTLKDTRAQLDAQAAQLPDKDSVPESVWQTIQPQYEQLQAAYAQLAAGEAQLEQAKAETKAGWNSYFLNRADVVEQLDESEQALADAKQELDDARQELDDGRQKIADAEQEITDGEQKLADAEAEYADGEDQLSELEYPDCYVLTRDENVGYACFESDSDIVSGVSRVFPLFFFMVAALVCITTMTRMVDEQRTQTGVLKALGYSDGAIMSRFLFYAASASILGCICGILAGAYFLPRMIWQAYNIMYGFTAILWAFDWPLAVISSLSYLLCAMAATWYACVHELTRPAAELIRPKAPKAGRRILLERIPWLWKRIAFLHKVSIRNTLRYKKRMVMMAIGIGGCTALLITGFGIRDSIQNVVQYQYEEITLYDATADFTQDMDASAQAEFLDAHSGVLDSAVFVSDHTLDCSAGSRVKQAHVVAVQGGSLDGFIDLHTERGEPVACPQDGECIISVGLSQSLGVSAGDTLRIRDSQMREMNLKISGVFVNYVFNYVYLTPQTYTEQMGLPCEMKTAWLNLNPDTDPYAAAAELTGDSLTTNVALNVDLHTRVENMMKSLDYIVLLVVVCAGALAFIVLYNLTNINITERVREIATVKVLGFYDQETNSYVFRENIILTVLGVIVGIPMGIALHAYVMAQIHIDMIHFDVRITALSFLISAALTLVFGMIVNLALRGKIRRIDMAQALKSIE